MSIAVRAMSALEELHRTEGQAELIGGKVVRLVPTGFRPGVIGRRICRAIDDYAAATGRGVALPDNVGFVVPELSSGRESFAPDASYYLGPIPAEEMDFLPAAPAFAVEVRSKSDYGPAAEAAMAAKRADYFVAGTVVVWDVDPLANAIRAYRASDPDRPAVFVTGMKADADAVMPGWRLSVDVVFG